MPSVVSVIFDLDGTLIDSLPDVTAALNHALSFSNRRPLDIAETRSMVGDGVRTMIQKAFAATGAAAGEKEISETFELYRAFYLAHPAERTVLFPDMRTVLDELHYSGISLGVCTNKPHELALAVLSALNLSRLFDGVLGGDRAQHRKPDGRHIHDTLQIMGKSKTGAVMVGDSDVDMLAAHDAGIPSIYASWGYHQLCHPLTANARVNSYRELPLALDRLGLKRGVS